MQHTHFYGDTHTGKVRDNNEDNLIFQNIWDKNHILGVAIDGVGGYDGGEVAAEIAKDTIIEYLEKYPNGERLEMLKAAVTEANNRIVEQSEKQPQYAHMSCVLTACLVEVEKRQINMVHIGDSRLYQFYKGELKKLSSDHSYVGYREDIGDLSEEEAMNHPRRNEISRLLGDKTHNPDDRDFLEAETFPLVPNSTLLLCSDGLTDLVTRAEMSKELGQQKTLEEKVQSLIDLANEKGGKDNITVVLIEYQSDEVVENVEVVEVIDTPTQPTKQTLNDSYRDRKIDVKQSTETQHDNNKKSKSSKMWIILPVAVLFALIIGAAGGWFGKKHFMPENQELRDEIQRLREDNRYLLREIRNLRNENPTKEIKDVEKTDTTDEQ